MSSRVLLGFSLLVLLVIERSPLPALTVSVLGIAMLEGGWKSILRALKVIRWLVIPILLLHAVLSGGERIWPDSGLPLTTDGLQIGVILSLKLAAYFSMAMLWSRLFRREEMMGFLTSVPLLGRRLYPYISMLTGIRHTVLHVMGRYRQQFQLRRHWRKSGMMLTTLIDTTFRASTDCSKSVWLRWPAQMPVRKQVWTKRNDIPILIAGVIVSLMAVGL